MTLVTLCVDALDPQLSGIGRYTWELYKGLEARPDIAAQYYGRNQLVDDPSRMLTGALPPPSRLRRWSGERSIRRSLVHGPNYFLPAFVDTGIITVHDLSVFRFPDTHPVDRVQAFEREFLRSLSRAAHVITDTHTVRAELIETFGTAPDMVTAIPLGVDASFRPRAGPELDATLNSHGLEAGRYGLCVSTLEPRKKIGELLSAWRRLPTRLRDAFPLVLCGATGWRNEDLRAEIRAGVAEGWLVHLGFVQEASLPNLYSGAGLFVYPSVYEGFGLPLIEAMASGIPVIASKHSCLPEVGSSAACYFDPDDAGAFIEALEMGLTHRDWRADAVQRGLAHSRDFTWSRCIEQTVALYHETTKAMGGLS